MKALAIFCGLGPPGDNLLMGHPGDNLLMGHTGDNLLLGPPEERWSPD